ncbi:MAG: FAD:protein transferase [Clostridia bacterium]|nr:FAD:protein transferase [Clostridia bacterium]
MYFKKLSQAIIILFLLIFTITGCSIPLETIPEKAKDNIEPVAKTTFLMGTIVKITIFDKLENDAVFTKVFDRIEEIENKMTINKNTDKSEIIKLNNAAGKDFVQLSPETFYVLEKGRHFSVLSNGQFDITIGPIVKLWNIDKENASVPDDTLIKNKLPLVNYRNLLLNKTELKAKLLKEKMIVDLGAIAKGYAADEVAKILKENGIKHAIINLGGNILTLGTKPDGTLWRLGLQDPYEPRGDYMAIVKLNNQTLVSSGTYEKYFEQNGKRYHHIIDPQTGYPAENNLISVSIITRKSIDGDALSTAIFLLGLEKGMKLIEKSPDTEAIFITNDKKVYVSSGINEDIFKIVDDQYKLQK